MEGHRLSELRDAQVPFWAVFGSVVLVVVFLLTCCTICVLLCFSPENRQGPKWSTSASGPRWVRPFGSPNGWLGYARHDDALPELTPKAPPGGVGPPANA